MKTTTTKLDKIAKTLGRRCLSVDVKDNVATVTVRANADADDCIEEAREAVGAVLPQTLSAAWADETREAVVVEAWL